MSAHPLRRLVLRERATPEGTGLLLFPHGGLGDRVVFEALVRDAVERAGTRQRIVVATGYHADEYDARRYLPAPDEIWILASCAGETAGLAAEVQRAGEAAFGWAGPVRTTCFGPPLTGAGPEVAGVRFLEPYAELAALAARGTFPRFAPAAPALARGAKWASRLRAPGGPPVVALHCRARPGDPGKNLAVAAAMEAASALRAAFGARIVAIGDDAPAPLASAADATVGGSDPALDDLAAILGRCDAFVGGESGPMHLAAAVGTPVVAILDPAKAGGRWGPFAPPGRRREVIGARAADGAPLSFGPREIVDAVRSLLDEGATAPRGAR